MPNRTWSSFDLACGWTRQSEARHAGCDGDEGKTKDHFRKRHTWNRQQSCSLGTVVRFGKEQNIGSRMNGNMFNSEQADCRSILGKFSVYWE